MCVQESWHMYIHECLWVPHLKLHGWDQPRCSCGYVTYVIMFVVCSWLHGWQSSAILGEGLLPQSSLSCVFILLFIGGCFFVGSFYTCRFTWFQLWNSEKIFSKFVLVFWHLNRGKKEVQETFYSIENNSKTNYSKLEMELKYSPSAVE